MYPSHVSTHLILCHRMFAFVTIVLKPSDRVQGLLNVIFGCTENHNDYIIEIFLNIWYEERIGWVDFWHISYFPSNDFLHEHLSSTLLVFCLAANVTQWIKNHHVAFLYVHSYLCCSSAIALSVKMLEIQSCLSNRVKLSKFLHKQEKFSRLGCLVILWCLM